jgi:hypothetical protein
VSTELLEPLSPTARALVGAERSRPDFAGAPADAVMARLSATLALGGAAVAVSSSAKAIGAAKSALLPKVVVAAVAASVGGVGAGVPVYVAMARSNRALEHRVQELESRPPPAPPLPEAPRVEAAPPPPPALKPGPHRRTAAPDSLQAENALIDRARTALLRKDASAALTALEEHEHAYARGRLAEERDAIKVQVLVQLHRREDAIAAAEVFRRKYPHSMALPGIQAAIDSAR